MTDIRKEIIDAFSAPQKTENLYTELKCCLILDSRPIQDVNFLDIWFKRVIDSLYY